MATMICQRSQRRRWPVEIMDLIKVVPTEALPEGVAMMLVQEGAIRRKPVGPDDPDDEERLVLGETRVEGDQIVTDIWYTPPDLLVDFSKVVVVRK